MRVIPFVALSSLALAACGAPTTAVHTTSSPSPTPGIHWSPTAPPAGIDVAATEWVKIEGAGGDAKNVQIAAVLRPTGPGPFPLVILLHGGVGLHVIDVSKAVRLTSAGFEVLVGCWELTSPDPEVYEGVSFPTIPCPMNNASPDTAVRALIDVGRQLPGITTNAIGLFGGSAGGPQALHAVGTPTDIKAVVVDSSRCSPPRVYAPVLMLGGTADPLIPIDQQRSCEQTLRDNGSTVESHFYEGGSHAVTYFGGFQDDAVRRMIDFFRRYLTSG